MKNENVFNVENDTMFQCFGDDFKNVEMALQAISLLKADFKELKNQYEIAKNTIAIKDGTMSYLVKVENILYLEAKSNYTYIYTRDNKPFFTSKTLKYWQNKLPTSVFKRCHKSFLINLNEVMQINASENIILMADHCIIKVSRNRVKEIKDSIVGNDTIIRQL